MLKLYIMATIFPTLAIALSAFNTALRQIIMEKHKQPSYREMLEAQNLDDGIHCSNTKLYIY